MDKKEAFKIVFDDLQNNGCNLFQGKYDARHGDENFMCGICTVLEYIARNISEDCLEEFDTKFFQNIVDSQEQAEQQS